MKNYLIKLSIFLSLLLPASAFAIQEVGLSSGAVIGVGGETLTVSGTPDKVVTTDTNATFTISGNTTITITDTSKSTMTFSQPAGANQLTTALTCNTSNSVYTITNPTAGVTGLQITVTPTGSVCSGSGSSGNGGSGGAGAGGGGGAASSGGGGGGSSAPAATPAASVPAPVATVTLPVPAPVAVVVPSTAGTNNAVVAIVSRQIRSGERSNDVKNVQEALSRDPDIYPEGSKTGFFGPATLRAVKKFQEKYGVAKKGDVGYGVFGPKTRAKFNEVYGGTGTSVSTPASATVASTPASTMTAEARNTLILSLLQKVAELQAALKALSAGQ